MGSSPHTAEQPFTVWLRIVTVLATLIPLPGANANVPDYTRRAEINEINKSTVGLHPMAKTGIMF